GTLRKTISKLIDEKREAEKIYSAVTPENGPDDPVETIYDAHLYDEQVRRLATHPTLVALAESMLGSKVSLWRSTFWIKSPSARLPGASRRRPARRGDDDPQGRPVLPVRRTRPPRLPAQPVSRPPGGYRHPIHPREPGPAQPQVDADPPRLTMSDWSTRLESLLRSTFGAARRTDHQGIVDLAFEAVFGVCILIASALATRLRRLPRLPLVWRNDSIRLDDSRRFSAEPSYDCTSATSSS